MSYSELKRLVREGEVVSAVMALQHADWLGLAMGVMRRGSGGVLDAEFLRRAREQILRWLEVRARSRRELADRLPGVGRDRLMRDMDAWGYSFRLGSTQAWFADDAGDAADWLVREGLLSADGTPIFRLRGEA